MKKIYLLTLLSIFSLNLFCQTNWEKHANNPVMVPGSAGEWDAEYVAPGSVIFYDNQYHMWYNGTLTNSQIGYATSPDGITWTKDANNPVLIVGQAGAWDESNVQAGYVLKTDTLFHMWYTGHGGTVGNANYQIGHATSTDGIIWTKDTINNPVLSIGPDGDWDDKWLYGGPVIFDGTKLHTWYTAWGGGPENVRIGHATSTDGITWTKDTQNPVVSFEAGKWDYPRAEGPIVIFDGLTYHMWYGGGESGAVQIGYATSVDGSVWTKYENNPVLSPGTPGSWDDKWISAGAVIDSAGVKYKMWYAGSQTDETGSIGYAESEISAWEQMENMPQATNYYGSCIDSVNEKSYFFGGQAPSPSNALSLLSTTQIYDFKTDTWSLGANMPKAASSFSAEIVNGKIYIIGEFLNPRVLTNVQEYDPVSDIWSTKGQLPEIFYAHGTCVYDGLIYSFGGRDVNFNLINAVRTYDPLTDTWSELKEMPYAKDKSAVCIYKNEIYLFGAYPSLKYTPSTDSWTELNSGECEIMAYATPIIDGDRIVLFGGYKEGVNYPNPSNEIWVYYPDNDTMVQQLNEMPFNRFTRGHEYNNHLYLFGGHYNNTLGSVTEEVWRFNLDSLKAAGPGTGIANTKANQTVLIYPNPTNDILHLKVPAQFQDEFDVKMISVTGKLIFQKTGYIEQIDISDIPSGVYLISVKSKDFVSTKKIIKQ